METGAISHTAVLRDARYAGSSGRGRCIDVIRVKETKSRSASVPVSKRPAWKSSTWRQIKGAYGRRRRALRKAVLEPVLVGWPVLREVVTNALAARGHLVLCELGDVRFFVDPGDRVVGAWLMWHGGWQRREIIGAVDVLAAAGRLAPDSVFVDVGAHIGTH